MERAPSSLGVKAKSPASGHIAPEFGRPDNVLLGRGCGNPAFITYPLRSSRYQRRRSSRGFMGGGGARDQIRTHRLHCNRYRVASREFIKCTAFATASPSAPTNHSLIARDSPSRWQAKPNPRRGKSKSGRTVQVARTTSFETSFFNPDHRVRADPSRPN